MRHELEVLLHKLARVDRRAAVWCACLCARTALHLTPRRVPWPRRAICTAEAWVVDEATVAACRLAAVRASTTDRAASCAARSALPESPPGTCFAAAHAAATHIAHAIAGLGAGGPRWRRALSAHLDRLLVTVSAQRWPSTAPTPAQLQAAPDALQVAWDHTHTASPSCGSLSIPELIVAWARGRRLGLDWSDPVSRAIAERPADEALLSRVLAPHGVG